MFQDATFGQAEFNLATASLRHRGHGVHGGMAATRHEKARNQTHLNRSERSERRKAFVADG